MQLNMFNKYKTHVAPQRKIIQETCVYTIKISAYSLLLNWPSSSDT